MHFVFHYMGDTDFTIAIFSITSIILVCSKRDKILLFHFAPEDLSYLM